MEQKIKKFCLCLYLFIYLSKTITTFLFFCEHKAFSTASFQSLNLCVCNQNLNPFSSPTIPANSPTICSLSSFVWVSTQFWRLKPFILMSLNKKREAGSFKWSLDPFPYVTMVPPGLKRRKREGGKKQINKKKKKIKKKTKQINKNENNNNSNIILKIRIKKGVNTNASRMRAISVADSPPAPFKASLGAGRSAGEKKKKERKKERKSGIKG